MVVSNLVGQESEDVLVESNGVICQAQVPKNQKPGEEAAKWYHLEEWEPNGHEKVERGSRCHPKDN